MTLSVALARSWIENGGTICFNIFFHLFKRPHHFRIQLEVKSLVQSFNLFKKRTFFTLLNFFALFVPFLKRTVHDEDILGAECSHHPGDSWGGHHVEGIITYDGVCSFHTHLLHNFLEFLLFWKHNVIGRLMITNLCNIEVKRSWNALFNMCHSCIDIKWWHPGV